MPALYTVASTHGDTNPMIYGRKFFTGQRAGSVSSAERTVPVLLELVGGVKTVVDLGCGTGTWLAAFMSNGVEDVRGYDGDYVPRDMLLIPADRFQGVDLTKPLTPEEGRRADLAISLEVGEHLPTPASETLVASLTAMAPVVAFSAAVPLQGGRDHINEQWPDFWADLFDKHGYTVVDAVRPRVWEDDAVDFWYRQNILLYVQSDRLDDYPALAEARQRTDRRMLSVVHPLLLADRNASPLSPVTHQLAWAARSGMSRLKRRIMG